MEIIGVIKRNAVYFGSPNSIVFEQFHVCSYLQYIHSLLKAFIEALSANFPICLKILKKHDTI